MAGLPDKPISNVEKYLAVIAGESVELPSAPLSRLVLNSSCWHLSCINIPYTLPDNGTILLSPVFVGPILIFVSEFLSIVTFLEMLRVISLTSISAH